MSCQLLLLLLLALALKPTAATSFTFEAHIMLQSLANRLEPTEASLITQTEAADDDDDDERKVD